MLDTPQKLEVSLEEVAAIEAALHTQSKILNMQASAGGATARQRLNVIKGLLSRLAQQRPAPRPAPARRGMVWFGLSRIFG